MKSPLLALILSLSPSYAALIGGVDFGDSRAEVTKKLENATELQPIADAPQGKQLQRSHQMTGRVAHQDWVVSFEFDRSGKELLAIHVDGMEAIPFEQFDEALKSFYLYVTEAVKKAYGINTDRSENTPSFKPSPELHEGKRFPIHIYDFNGVRLMMTLRMDLDTKQVYVGYSLYPAAEESALGSTELPNNDGDASDWVDIPTWESLKFAEEFLYKNGLKERPKPKQEGAEGSEPSEEKVPDHFDKIDTSLPSSEQALLKGLIVQELGKYQEAASFYAQAAREDTGNGRAFYQLAICFETGAGVEQDIDKSANAYLKAAQLGYAPALVRFGPEFKVALEELGMTPEEGAAILDKAHELAAANSVWGRYNLATFYRYGYGLRKDVDKARALFASLAQQGDKEAEVEHKNCH